MQEEYIKEEQQNLKRELLRAQEEVKRIQAVPLVIGQFLEMVDQVLLGCVRLPHAGTGRVRLQQEPSTQPSASCRQQADRACRPQVLIRSLPVKTQTSGIVGSTTGSNYYVRILSTLNRELLKPSSSVALHRHSNALVDILPPEADSSISLLSQSERPDVTYQASDSPMTQ